MTDDKAIEAALDAWFGNPHSKQFAPEQYAASMRAALAAADKVRAEGKLPDIPDNAFICAFYDERGNYIGDIGAKPFRAFSTDAAFAAGLAKGEAERAALVEALKPFAWFASLLPKSVPDYMPLKADLSGSGDLTVAHLRAAALALVRKGV